MASKRRALAPGFGELKRYDSPGIPKLPKTMPYTRGTPSTYYPSGAGIGRAAEGIGTETNQQMVQNYSFAPLSDGSLNTVAAYQVLFAIRSYLKYKNLAVMSPTYLNRELKRAYYTGVSNLSRKKDGFGLDELKRIPAELAYDIYSNHASDPTYLDAMMADESVSASFEESMGHWSTVFKKKTDYYGLTASGILNHWNFLGTVINMSISGTGFSYEIDTKREGKHIAPRIASVVCGGDTAILNYWGANNAAVKQGAKLYFILRRVMVPSKTDAKRMVPAHFEFRPFVNSHSREIPLSELAYEDITGRVRMGHSIYVGSVIETPKRRPSKANVSKSLGSVTTTADVITALTAMPTVRVSMAV